MSEGSVWTAGLEFNIDFAAESMLLRNSVQ